VTVRNNPAPEVRVIEAYESFEEVLVDFMTKLPNAEAGNVNIFVVVDNFTKFMSCGQQLKPVPDLLAETCYVSSAGDFSVWSQLSD
jgi:hypothetical protein